MIISGVDVKVDNIYSKITLINIAAEKSYVEGSSIQITRERCLKPIVTCFPLESGDRIRAVPSETRQISGAGEIFR